jgi:hypothetical protein
LISAPPFKVFSRGAQFWANTYNNAFPTAGNDALQYANTSDFAQLVGATGLALTAAGCRVTYTGDPSYWLVTLTMGLTALLPPPGLVTSVFPFVGIDLDGDLLGALLSGANPNPYTNDTTLVGNDVASIGVTRIVLLNNGSHVQPVCGATPAPTGNIAPDTLLMTMIPMGFA